MGAGKWIGILGVVAAVGGASAYFYYTTTPLFAFSEAGVSVATHDINRFHKSVDLDTMVDGAVQDLLTDPLQRTPGMSEMQKTVLNGASEIARKKISQALILQADQFVSNSAPSSPPMDSPHTSATQPADTTKDTGLKAVLDQKIANLKSVASAKMKQYAAAHPDSFQGRMLNLPEDERKVQLKRLLGDYGFTPQNFRGVAYCNESSAVCTTGARFFSPKLNHEVIVDIDLVKSAEGWRISRISNLPIVINQVEPSYQTDLQELAIYSVGELNSAVKETAHEMADRVKSKITAGLSTMREMVRKNIEAKAAGLAPPMPFPGGSPPGPPRPLEELRKRFGRKAF